MSEEFEYLEEYRHPYSACLNLTDSCNLFCVYCFVQQQPNFMTFQVAKDGVDWLAANLNWWREYTHDPQFKGSITYFGGEPTLMWDEIIVPLTAYIKETYPDYFDLTITTNGTLLNEERIKFLYDNQIYPLLSIDGVKEVQDYNRPTRDGSSGFDKLIQIIPTLLHYFPYTTFRSTVHNDTVQYLFESYLFAEQMNFKNIFWGINHRVQWKQDQLKELNNQLNKIFIYRILHYMNNEPMITSGQIDKVFQSIISTYQEKTNSLISRNASRCGLGTTSLSIGYDGSLIGCQEQTSRDTRDKFYLGNIYQDIDKEKHIKLLKEYTKPAMEHSNVFNSKECSDCICRKYCNTSICPSVGQDLYNSFFIKPLSQCVFDKILFNNCITTLKFLLDEEDNKLFQTYLDELVEEMISK